MRFALALGIAVFAWMEPVLAQPAKVREEVTVLQNPDGEVVGKLSPGDDVVVRSRTTTESGTWCRIASSAVNTGSVPCKLLAISQPPPPPPPAPAPAPARKVARVAAKPEAPPVTAMPVQGDTDQPLIEHPTPAQMRRAFPDHGDVRPTQPTIPAASLVQQYKFTGDSDLALSLWVRAAGDTSPGADAELMKKVSQTQGRTKIHLLPGGRKARWSVAQGDFVVTGTSPDGQYEWTMVYTTPEDPEDVTSYVLQGATALSRLLFGR